MTAKTKETILEALNYLIERDYWDPEPLKEALAEITTTIPEEPSRAIPKDWTRSYHLNTLTPLPSGTEE